MFENNIPVYVNYGEKNFNEMYYKFLKFLETVPFSDLNKIDSHRKTAGIIVCPRNNSGIPFCNLTIALIYLYKSEPVSIIWDDLDFIDETSKNQNTILGKVINLICANSSIKLLRLSEYPDEPINSMEDRYIRKLATSNAIWNVRKVVPSKELKSYELASYNALRINSKKIKSFYKSNNFTHCVHQSLINENGGLHKLFANKYNIRMSSLDIAAGRGQMSTNDVPAYHSDLLKIVYSPIFKDDANRNIALACAKSEFSKRMEGKDSRGYQKISSKNDKESYTYDVIMPLNILFDGAALNRNRLFKTPFEWATDTVQFIIKHTNLSIVVRQHPNERKYSIYGTGVNLGDYLKSKFDNYPNFRFISCDEDVNTYSLVKNAKIVIPYTSSVGLEAALLGKIVIAESDVYYSDLPIILKPKSKQDYFDSIKHYGCTLNQKIAHSEDNINLGWILYFLVHDCPRIRSDFGLEPNDFEKWTQKGFNSLINDEDLMYAIYGLSSDTAYAYMNCIRILDRLKKRFNRVIEHSSDPNDTTNKTINLALYLINNNDFETAIDNLLKLPNIDDDVFLYIKSYSLAKSKSFKQSLRYINKLIEKKPSNKKAIGLRNEILLNLA